MKKYVIGLLIAISFIYACNTKDSINLDINELENTENTLNTFFYSNSYKSSKNILKEKHCLDTSFIKKLQQKHFKNSEILTLDNGCYYRKKIKTEEDFKNYLCNVLPEEKKILENFSLAYLHEVLFENKEIPLTKEIEKNTGFVLFVKEGGGYAVYPIEELRKFAQQTPSSEDDKIVNILEIIYGKYLFNNSRLVIYDNYEKVSLLGNGEFLKIFRILNRIRHQDTTFYDPIETLILKCVIPYMRGNYKYNKFVVRTELQEIISIARDSAYLSFELIDSLNEILQDIENDNVKFNCKCNIQ